MQENKLVQEIILWGCAQNPQPHKLMLHASQSARDHYVFTSHAGTPLAVWDLRRMGAGPLYQEERLLLPWEYESGGRHPSWQAWWWGSDAGGVFSSGGESAVGAAREEREEEEFGGCRGPRRHQGLWLAASHDTLLGRDDAGAWSCALCVQLTCLSRVRSSV